MKTIAEILKKQKIEIKKNERPINENFEIAKEFGGYVGLSTLFILRQFKVYGKSKVLRWRGWLKDIPYDKSKGGKEALLVWRLKNPSL